MLSQLLISLSLLVLLTFTLFTYHRSNFKGRMYFLFSGLSIAVWIAAALMEVNSNTLNTKMIWTSVTWIGAGGVSASYLFFIYEFLLGRKANTLYTIPIIILSSFPPALLGATSSYHGMFFGYNTYITEQNGISYAAFERELLWYGFASITHSYVIVTLLVLIVANFKSSKYFLPQAVALLLATSFPLFFNLTYIFLDFRVYAYNFTPFSFLISFILIAGIVYLGRSFNMETISADLLFHQGINPTLVTNEDYTVFACNPSLEQLCESNNTTPTKIRDIVKATDIDNIKMPEVKLGIKTFLLNHLIISAPVKLGKSPSVIGHTYQLIDITLQKGIEAKFRNLSETDWLTQVSSRGHFMDTLERNSKRFSLGLFILDLDYFKRLNDKFGHDVGDQALIEIGKKLIRISGEQQTPGRLGGEEFILFREMNTTDELEEFAKHICNSVNSIELSVNLEKLNLTGSVGAVLLEKNGDVSQALKAADKALYEAKAAGRDRYSIASLSNRTS